MTDECILASSQTSHPRPGNAYWPGCALAIVFALGCSSAQAGGTPEQIEQAISIATTNSNGGGRTKPASSGGNVNVTTALDIAAGVPGGTNGATNQPAGSTSSSRGATALSLAAPTTASSSGCQVNIQRQNSSGFINTTPQVYNIYWGNYWNQTSGSPSGSSQQVAIDNEWSWVGNSAAFWNRLVEYGIDPNHSSWKGSFIRETTVDAKTQILPETTIQTMLGAEFDQQVAMNSPDVPSATTNPPQIWVIFLPPNVQSGDDVDANGNNIAGGHHLSFPWRGRNVWYAIIEYTTPTSALDIMASHEIAEAATDPDTVTGYRDPSRGTNDEIADQCEQPTNIKGFNFQSVWSQQRCRCVSRRDAYTSDFGGNGKSSYTIYRPSTGVWWVNSGVQGNQTLSWGVSSDFPVPGDYNGDGWIDVAIFRPSTGQWMGTYSSPFGINTWTQWMFGGASAFTTNWGANGDVPIPADWDNDGQIDLTVFRPSNGTWYGLLTSSGSGVSAAWGAYGDLPVPADYDGDAKPDVAVYRPSNTTFYIAASTAGAYSVAWGVAGDIPVPADFDGDGKADIAIWRPSNGTWYVRPSTNTSTMSTQQWGVNGDIPVPLDYDADWRADYAVWRPSNGTWYVIPTTTGGGYSVQWGVNGDNPMLPDR